MEKVAIVDYGLGNLHSVHSALLQVADGNIDVCITHDVNEISDAERVVFPGQGAAQDCMQAIDSFELRQAILKAASEKPFLGICMGMQVLLERSDENEGTDCLGLYKGKVKNFTADFNTQHITELKVPHMGWNTIQHKIDHPLWAGIPQDSYFYFVHSYYVSVDDQTQVAGLTDYGFEFASVVASDKVFAMQCHPEKSADNGLTLLNNFLHWSGH